MDNIKFSIITVCFNAGDKLLQTVQNALRQDYDNFEIVVKDGGSTDYSLRRVTYLHDERVKIYEGKDTGIYDAMNQAVKLATGDYVLFLNAGDEFYSEDVITKASKLLKATTNTIAYGDTYFSLYDSLSKAPAKITGSVCYRNIPCHQAILYSRDTLLERGFDTSFKIRADFEHFAYSFFKAHRDFVYLGFPICYYEGGGFSESKKNKKRDKMEYRKAVKLNIPLMNRFAYRLTLIVTFHKLRGYLSRNPRTAKWYQSVKSRIISK